MEPETGRPRGKRESRERAGGQSENTNKHTRARRSKEGDVHSRPSTRARFMAVKLIVIRKRGYAQVRIYRVQVRVEGGKMYVCVVLIPAAHSTSVDWMGHVLAGHEAANKAGHDILEAI